MAIAVTSLGFAQTSDEDEVMFAAGVLGIKMQSLIEGDLTDRSADFPKTKGGALMQGVYRFTLRGIVRDAYLDRKVEDTKYYELITGQWCHSPKAALRELAKVTALYSASQVAMSRDNKEVDKLLLPTPGDPSPIRDFKAGGRDGVSRGRQKLGSKSPYTLVLICLSRWEDVYHFLDQNRKDWTYMGDFVAFEDVKLAAEWSQKLLAVDRASEALDQFINAQGKRMKELKPRLKSGFGSVSG